MAEAKEVAPKERLVVVDSQSLAREETAAEMKRLRKAPLDKTKPGGYFVTIDGTAHDAEGNEVEIDAADLEHVTELRLLQGLPDLGSEGESDGGTEPYPEAEPKAAATKKAGKKK